jgi:methionyl aminopeptidase
MIHIKTPEEIAKMRIAGKITAATLAMIAPYVQAGITTEELDKICHDYILSQDAIPAPLNYHGYPKSICTSINHVICHGIPGEKKLKDGDIMNIDITVIKDGYHADAGKMFMIGKPSILANRLVTVAKECLDMAIAIIKPGIHLGDIGATIQKHAEKHGFSVVREYCGHGIGKKFHEDPQVLHYGTFGTGIILEPGMVFTIEPMINAGKKETKLLPDNWTVITKDHSLSAQWEHTILVTENSHEILTE